jgi:hypothetical protein
MPFYAHPVSGRRSCIKAIMLLTRHHGFIRLPLSEPGICKREVKGHEVKPTIVKDDDCLTLPASLPDC